MVVGRRVLGAFVKSLCAGSGMPSPKLEDDEDWESKGSIAFSGDEGEDGRRIVVEGVLGTEGMGGWCDEQVRWILRGLS